jgi:hypothetical protein
MRRSPERFDGYDPNANINIEVKNGPGSPGDPV